MILVMRVIVNLLLLFGCFLRVFTQKPNIILILTDDQDSELDSLSAMPKLVSLIADKGATFTNSFVASPLCCPSRSSIFTGQYVHNHGTFNNSISGGCNSREWQKGPEQNTFPLLMNNAGYSTFFSGKYLNNYGFNDVGGVKHIPPGWNSWIALKGNSVYYNYDLSVNGTSVHHGNDPRTDYLTSVIKNEAVKFIEASEQSNPFFMMLSTPACHSPFTPEPQYEDSLNASSIPRSPNFNIVNTNKNWFVQLGEQPLKQAVINIIEDYYKNRLRTLLSVDDMVESVVEALESKQVLNNTYIFFTSDNGYHLGQFSMPLDKREPYEFDIKVPLLVRGPGIFEGIKIEDVAVNIDLAPTFLDFAQIPVPQQMDGKSLKSSLLGSKSTAQAAERTILIEHSGEGSDKVQKTCEYLGTGLSYCTLDVDCKCQDATNNTYNCVRTIGNGKNEKYCSWVDYEFEEYYDLSTDPYEVTNCVASLNTIQHQDLQQRLNNLIQCSGTNCNLL